MKTFESVHPYEIVNIGTTSLTRQEDTGDLINMDASYDFELNLSANHEPTSFEEDISYDEWK